MSFKRSKRVKSIKRLIRIITVALSLVTVGVAAKNAVEVIPDNKVGHKQGLYEKYIKRPLDFLCSSIALLLLSPVLAITAIAVRLKLGSPVLFSQERPGRDEKIFRLFKFRTMTDKKDASGELLPDSERLTPFGARLRSTSLDELPELINIIKGDMALIGPRPLLVRYLPYYSDRERARHSVRPGLTGLAQIRGRNYVKWDERLSYDVEYAENISFLRDAGIFIKTIAKVFLREDVAADPTDADEEYFDVVRKSGQNYSNEQ